MGNRQMPGDNGSGSRSMGNNNYDSILDNYEQRSVHQRRMNNNNRRSVSNGDMEDDADGIQAMTDENVNVLKRRRDDGGLQQQEPFVRRRNDSFSSQLEHQQARSQPLRRVAGKEGDNVNDDVGLNDQSPIQRRRRPQTVGGDGGGASPVREGDVDADADEDVTASKHNAAETAGNVGVGDAAPSMSPPTPPNVSTFREYREQAQHVWEGSLQLKATNFDVQCYHVDGSMRWINDILGPDLQTPLKITQRLRLEERKLEDVKERISAKESALVLAYNASTCKFINVFCALISLSFIIDDFASILFRQT